MGGVLDHIHFPQETPSRSISSACKHPEVSTTLRVTIAIKISPRKILFEKFNLLMLDQDFEPGRLGLSNNPASQRSLSQNKNCWEQKWA